MKTKKAFSEIEKFNTLVSRVSAEGKKQHHHALARGYRSLWHGCRLEPYSGQFGTGYVLHVPNALATCGNRYHWIVYFV